MYMFPTGEAPILKITLFRPVSGLMRHEIKDTITSLFIQQRLGESDWEKSKMRRLWHRWLMNQTITECFELSPCRGWLNFFHGTIHTLNCI